MAGRRSWFKEMPVLAICLTLGWVVLLPGNRAACQEQAPPAINELVSIMQAMDPYHPPNDAQKATVHVFGSTSMDAMAHGWIRGYKAFHPGVEVLVSGAGSEAVFERLIEQPTGIGMLSRPVTDAELEALKRKGLKNPIAVVVAQEALGVFVHRSNPVTSISGEQLRTVFTVENEQANETLTWAALNAPDNWKSKPIHVISRTKNSGTQRFLNDFVFCSCTLRDGISEHVSNAEVLQEVSANPLSIAICGLRSQGESVKVLQLMAGATAIPSDDHAVLSGQYPLTRPLTLLIDAGQTGVEAKAAQELIKFGLSRQGQTQAITVGFFPVDLPLIRASMQRLDGAEIR